ncbi:hypothetical protein V8E53_000843 [Lactarius tabidus]
MFALALSIFLLVLVVRIFPFELPLKLDAEPAGADAMFVCRCWVLRIVPEEWTGPAPMGDRVQAEGGRHTERSSCVWPPRRNCLNGILRIRALANATAPNLNKFQHNRDNIHSQMAESLTTLR